MAGTILLIEDEQDIAAVVRAYLERDGFAVVWATTGADGLAALARADPRLVVLDIGLPDGDGFEICRRIRARSDVPIVMLTARGEETDRIVGLEVGADDYVAKPFSARELVARVKAILRRTDSERRDTTLTLGDVVVRPRAREVAVSGEPVELRGKEFDLLCCLLENRGVVLSRDLLLDRVWGMEFAAGTRTVDFHVSQLRRKLGRPELIWTIRGVGYKAVQP